MTSALTTELKTIFKTKTAGWQDALEVVWPRLGQDDKRFVKIVTGGGGGSSSGGSGDDHVFAGTLGAQAGTGLAKADIITSAPAEGSVPWVAVNGRPTLIGDGTKTAPCFFSNDAGATARAYADIAANDDLYWNTTEAGYPLVGTETYLVYMRVAA